MAIVLSAAPVVEQELKKMQERSQVLRQHHIIPTLKVILVGDHAPSIIYTNNKKKFCEKFGAECSIVRLPADTSKQTLIDIITQCNQDPTVHGVMVQLPLPEHLADFRPGTLIDPRKDVDGMTPEQHFRLQLSERNPQDLIPCTPRGIVTLLNFYKIPIRSQRVVILGRSLIVGRPLANLLTSYDATVTLCHTKTENLAAITQSADIIIIAIGHAHFLTPDYINPQHPPIIIDVGISYIAPHKIAGDADFSALLPLVKAISPVPGGVGPMTILSLGQNLLQAAENALQNL